ncbi:MAG: C39 family peptidase [Anaerolineae bacterium]|nr:C39 family peptidase [Anaerolineae bacterium]
MPKHLLNLPNYRQQKESDCLAACAAMMLRALDIEVPYSELLSILDIVPWGTPHRNIVRLEEFVPGIHVKYGQGELIDLYRALDSGRPPTVFVWTGELPYWSITTWHAVVVVGYDELHFYVNDPAFEEAPQVVLHGDLDLAWLAYDSYYATVARS